MILHIKGLGKIVDRGVAQPQGDLTDGIAVFQQHLTASLQLFIIDVLFRGLVDGILEHQLQRRPRQRKVFADFRDRQRKVDVFINIGNDPVKQFIHCTLVHGIAGLVHRGSIGSLQQPDDDLSQQTEHQTVHIRNAGCAFPDERFY